MVIGGPICSPPHPPFRRWKWSVDSLCKRSFPSEFRKNQSLWPCSGKRLQQWQSCLFIKYIYKTTESRHAVVPIITGVPLNVCSSRGANHKLLVWRLIRLFGDASQACMWDTLRHLFHMLLTRFCKLLHFLSLFSRTTSGGHLSQNPLLFLLWCIGRETLYTTQRNIFLHEPFVFAWGQAYFTLNVAPKPRHAEIVGFMFVYIGLYSLLSQ